MAKRIQAFALSFAVFAGLPLVVPYHAQANLSTPQLAQAPTPAEATSVSDEDGCSMRVGRWQGQLN